MCLRKDMVKSNSLLPTEKVVQNLERLLEEESNLVESLTKEYNTIIRNTGDEVFAKLSTSDKKDDLKGIRWRIQKELKSAVDLGMQNSFHVYVIEHYPGKRTEIIIGEYITALNSKYQEKQKKVV